MISISKMETSNEFVPYRLVRRALDRKLLILRSAIHKSLAGKAGAVVVDVGTGGGLLAAWAAECDSVAQVYALDDDPLLIAHTRRALAGHPRRDRIVVIATDNLLTYAPPELCDLLLCEVVSTGLLQQPQAPLINHFLAFLKPSGVVLPSGIVNVVTLIDVGFTFLDGLISLPHVFEDQLGLAATCPITAPCLLSTLCFGEPILARTEVILRLPAITTGWVRAVRLESQVLVGDQQIERARSFCYPIIAPLTEPLFVEEGQVLELHCLLPHRQADTAGRASAGALPERLDITVVVARF